jgi:hypothetical protein
MPPSRSKGGRHPVFRVPNPWRSIPVPISISIGCPTPNNQRPASNGVSNPLT